MATIAVQKIEDSARTLLPIFQEIDKRIDQVQRRAFELSLTHGREDGHAMEDWFRAEHEIMGWPAAELAEIDGEYKLEMTLPGFDAKNVQVAATPTEIAVHAATGTKPDGEHLLWTEFGSNDVYRLFHLPQSINTAHMRAGLENGLLKITVAKMGIT